MSELHGIITYSQAITRPQTSALERIKLHSKKDIICVFLKKKIHIKYKYIFVKEIISICKRNNTVS